MDNNPLITRITRLEDEVEVLRKERDRFKRIASNAEEETAKRRVEYLTLESEYEEERRKRRNAEKLLDMKNYTSNSVSTSEPQASSSSAAMPDLAIPSKADSISIQVQTEHASSEARDRKDNQDIKEIIPNEVICIDIDDDAVLKIGPPVRASKRIPIKPQSKEVMPLTSLSSPKTEKKRPVDQISSSSGHPDEPVKKILKMGAESKPSTSKAVGDVPPPTASDSLIPKRVSKASGKAKAKDEGGFALSPSVVSQYMEGVAPYIIHPPPKPPRISRSCLTETYGLPGMGLLWISKDKRHRFLLPAYEVNPDMPSAAGAPGLLLSCRKEICDGLPWTLFIPAAEEKKARWIYAGEYIGETVGFLSAEDFRNHNQKLKEAWGNKIQKSKKYLVHCALRARITLRLDGSSDPTESEVENEVARIKRRGYTSNLTTQDVITAFERGDEHIIIVKLRCTNYKHEREPELTDAQALSDILEKKRILLKREGASRKNTTDRRIVGKQSSTQKRGKRMNRKESEDESDLEPDDFSDSDGG